jgi:aspartate/methionine/tyrosine aminotransferase
MGVASTPGVALAPARPPRYVRFSFAGSTDDMAEAAGRLKNWLGR